MNTLAWVSRSLATSAGTLALVDVVLAIIKGDPGRLLPAAGGMVVAAIAFELRTREYQYSSTRTLKFEALAAARPSDGAVGKRVSTEPKSASDVGASGSHPGVRPDDGLPLPGADAHSPSSRGGCEIAGRTCRRNLEPESVRLLLVG